VTAVEVPLKAAMPLPPRLLLQRTRHSLMLSAALPLRPTCPLALGVADASMLIVGATRSQPRQRKRSACSLLDSPCSTAISSAAASSELLPPHPTATSAMACVSHHVERLISNCICRYSGSAAATVRAAVHRASERHRIAGGSRCSNEQAMQ
jgi:hypothetical protein